MPESRKRSADLTPERKKEREALTTRKVVPSEVGGEVLEDLVEAQRREIRQDRYERFVAINPSPGATGPICLHPRETRGFEAIERREALSMLRIPTAEFSRLVRRGVIRKAHPDARSQYLYRDVAALASTAAGTEARTWMETQLRTRNVREYMLDFVEYAYYDLSGEPVPEVDMDYIDALANERYQEGLADLSVKFHPLLKPVPYTQARDYKNERAVQYAYMHDDPDAPRMTTALEMRRWYMETHPHARFHVRRVAIPPLESLTLPTHRGVLKFLVQAASILYHIDFEVMPEPFYQRLVDAQLSALEQSGNTPVDNVFERLTGARITDELELEQLLTSLDPGAQIPLRYQVAAWYRAYASLLFDDEPSTFKPPKRKYAEGLLRHLHEHRWDLLSNGEIEDLRHRLNLLIGAHPDWAARYRQAAPPVYIGQPPGYVPPPNSGTAPDPLRRHLHPGLRNRELPPNLSYLLGENSLEDASAEHIAAAKRVAGTLDKFHRTVIEVLPESDTVRTDLYMLSLLMAALRAAEIDARSLYLFPLRDAIYLDKRIHEHPTFDGNLLLDSVLPDFEARLAKIDRGTRSPEELASDQEQAAKEVEYQLTDVQPPPERPSVDVPVKPASEAERRQYIGEYARDILGLAPQQLETMTEQELLESVPMEALDAFVRARAEGAEVIMTLDDSERFATEDD